MNINIKNIGYGRHVFSIPVAMSYTNGNFSYVAQNCHVQWNGSTVTCTAPPGVGKGHRWTMNLFGFEGFQSAPSVVTNYKGPVLYDIMSKFNMTKTSASAGQDEFNITGANFGPISDNAVTWVRYGPSVRPAVQFTANCSLIVDHTTLKCITGPQAGEDLRWVISVGNQISEIPYTSTQIPEVSRVTVLQIGTGLKTGLNGTVLGAVPVRQAKGIVASNAYLGLSTTGGGLVVLRGT